MISQVDQARINKVAESSDQVPKTSEGTLDDLSAPDVQLTLRAMSEEHPRWVVVVNPTQSRVTRWWLLNLMLFFRDGISVLTLDDGREAFCTWAVR